MTLTVSSLRIFIAMASEDLRREGDDLHEVAVAQLAGHGAEDAGAARVVLGVDQHRGVLVEGDVSAVVPAELLLGADDDRLDHLALADAAVRDRLLHGADDHVAHPGIAPARAAGHADAQDLAGAGVVGHLEAGFLLDHPRSSVRIAAPWASENRAWQGRFAAAQVVARRAEGRTISPSPVPRRGASAWSCSAGG